MTDRVRLRLRARTPERFIGRALREGIRFQRIERSGAREMILCVSEKNALGLMGLAERFGMEMTVLGEAGKPRLRKQLIRRRSLPLGLVLSLMLIVSFTARIWRVEAVSLDGAADEGLLRAVCESAAALGAGPGRLRREIDRDALGMQIHAQFPSLTHVSVRADGIYLRVEVAMEEAAPEIYRLHESRNLVASRDAMIVYIEPLTGRACVQAGDIVRQGEILIAGEERMDAEAVRPVRAQGKAIGRVWFSSEVEAPMTETVYRRTGRMRAGTLIRLGAWRWPIAGAQAFDTQQTETKILPIGGLFLPLWIERTVFRETVEETVSVDPDALREETSAQALERVRAQLPGGARETDCRVYFTEKNGMLAARAVIEAEMDIAAGQGESFD